MIVLFASLQAMPVLAELKTQQIKAAYLYQISKFVFWPEQRKQETSFHVCQLGPDRYEGTLQKMTGRTVFNKPVSIDHVQSLDKATHCHLLIISSPQNINHKTLYNWLNKNQVLTVVDGANNIDVGMVVFVAENQRVRLHINQNLAKRSGLKFAANLLEIASHIERGDP